MMVKDKEYDEWTFVTGGAKPNEMFEQCAIRELYEETNCVLDIRKHNISLTRFYSFYFKNEIIHDKVLMHYKVIFLPLHRFGYNMKNCFKLEEKFIRNMNINKSPEYNETTYLRFMNLFEIQNSKVWSFIRRKVLNSIYFNEYLRNIS